VFCRCNNRKVVPSVVAGVVVDVVNVQTVSRFRTSYPGVDNTMQHRLTATNRGF